MNEQIHPFGRLKPILVILRKYFQIICLPLLKLMFRKNDAYRKYLY